ncbi:MAG TPA: hypothetical protein VJ179_00575 [Patescibacteria group bacterium]|nr:hypothetical protein [Patescibacteria group bacterium]
MSPITLQGFFHLYLDVNFFIIAILLTRRFRKSGNALLKYLALSFWFVAIEYITLGLPLLLIPQNFVLLRIISGPITMFFFLIAIGFMGRVFYYLYPKFPWRIFLVSYTLFSAFVLWSATFPFKPAFINEMGIIDYNLPKFVFIIIGLLLMTAYVPAGVVFIYHAFKAGNWVKGFIFGLGLIVGVLFQPLTYQIQVFSTWVFFSLLGSLGVTMITAGILLHLSPQKIP